MLVLLVLLVQRLAAGRLDGRWQYALWLAVVVRLVLPWAPSSSLSVNNAIESARTAWVEARAARAGDASAAPEALATGAAPGAVSTDSPEGSMAEEGLVSDPAVVASASVEGSGAVAGSVAGGMRRWHERLGWRGMLEAIWLAGVLVFGGGLAWQHFELWRAIKGRRPLTDTETLDLLEECKERMGVGTLLAIVPTDRVSTPALYGLVRPRLLLPAGMASELSRQEMRHVLLHELGHLRRLDIHVGWLVAILQVLHWFNPLVWMAFARMRIARELACDQTVLRVLGVRESRQYGQTILNMVERWSVSRRLPSLAAVLEDESQLARRITMISRYSSPAHRSIWPWALVVALAVVGLTNAEPRERVPVASTPANEARPSGPRTADVVLKYDDDTMEGKWSLAMSGHAVEYDRPVDAHWVESVEIFAARYGTPEPPKEYFHLYVLNAAKQVLADVPFHYGLIGRGDQKWYTLKTPSIEVTEKFSIAFDFNPHPTKGVYLGLDESVEKSHSLQGLPDDGYKPVDKKFDWMVRVHMNAQPSGAKGTRKLADWKPPRAINVMAGTVAIPDKLAPTQDKQSYGGSGPAVDIEIPAGLREGKVKGISLYASRYGAGFDPKTTMVQVAILDSKDEVRWQGEVPYGSFAFTPKWVTVALPQPMPVSDLAGEDGKLRVAIDPQAHQKKGVLFYYQKVSGESHSLVGTVESKFNPVADREWLIRVHVEKPGVSQPTGARRPTG